eukprot:3736824-Alexandrium_andersonii.AAC.1
MMTITKSLPAPPHRTPTQQPAGVLGAGTYIYAPHGGAQESKNCGRPCFFLRPEGERGRA